MMTRDQAFERIKKLLALADSDNEHESAQALARAQALMERHKIEAHLLEEEAEEEPEEIRAWEDPLDPGHGSQLAKWKWALAWFLCRANGCIPLKGSRPGGFEGRRATTIRIVGRASNVQTTRYLYQFAVKEIERHLKKYRGNGHSWRNSFRYGCAEGIRDAISAERRAVHDHIRAQHASDSALVKVENAIAKIAEEANEVQRFTEDEMGIRWRSGSRIARDNTDGRSTGHRTGRDIYASSRSSRGAVGPGGQRLIK